MGHSSSETAEIHMALLQDAKDQIRTGTSCLNALIEIISKETLRLSHRKTVILQSNISALLSQLHEDNNDRLQTSSDILDQLNVGRSFMSNKVLYLD